MTENVLYYGRGTAAWPDALKFSPTARNGCPFSHPLFTAMTGNRLGCRGNPQRFHQSRRPVLGFMLAVLNACNLNGSATFGGDTVFFAAYLELWRLLSLYVMVYIFLAASRRPYVRQFLYSDYSKRIFDLQDTKALLDSGPDGNVLVRAD